MKKKLNTSDQEKVLYIAGLAKLNPKKSEIANLNNNFKATIDYISQLKNINTENVSLTTQVTGLVNVTREDEIDTTRVLSQKEALRNANRVYKGFFVVKAILEESI